MTARSTLLSAWPERYRCPLRTRVSPGHARRHDGMRGRTGSGFRRRPLFCRLPQGEYDPRWADWAIGGDFRRAGSCGGRAPRARRARRTRLARPTTSSTRPPTSSSTWPGTEPCSTPARRRPSTASLTPDGPAPPTDRDEHRRSARSPDRGAGDRERPARARYAHRRVRRLGSEGRDERRPFVLPGPIHLQRARRGARAAPRRDDGRLSPRRGTARVRPRPAWWSGRRISKSTRRCRSARRAPPTSSAVGAGSCSCPTTATTSRSPTCGSRSGCRRTLPEPRPDERNWLTGFVEDLDEPVILDVDDLPEEAARAPRRSDDGRALVAVGLIPLVCEVTRLGVIAIGFADAPRPRRAASLPVARRARPAARRRPGTPTASSRRMAPLGGRTGSAS